MRSRAHDRAQLARARRRGRRGSPRGRRTRPLPRRRHEPRRPDARDGGDAVRPGRRHRSLGRDRPDRRWRPDDRRGGPQHGGGRARGGQVRATRCSPARSWPAPRRRSATWRRRRQSAAAHALHVLLRHRRLALQQAVPGRRVRRDRGFQPHARDPRYVIRVRGHSPVGHVRRARGSRRRRPSSERVGRAHGRPLRSAQAARGSSRYRDGARAGRADHRGRAACAQSGRTLDLSQGP